MDNLQQRIAASTAGSEVAAAELARERARFIDGAAQWQVRAQSVHSSRNSCSQAQRMGDTTATASQVTRTWLQTRNMAFMMNGAGSTLRMR